jgi:hypothetical protein
VTGGRTVDIVCKGRMMKRCKNSIILTLLFLIIGLFLAVAITGCDSVAADCKERHLRLGEIARQQLQYGPSSYTLNPQPGTTYHPAK